MPADLVGFNFAKTYAHPENVGIHFFLKDYQFTRVWASPDRYTEMLARFRFVCTPDFSLYTDFPQALQIYNHYRKHWLGAYWQSKGMMVVPTICWSDESSFEWCFDGEPLHSTVAVSSVGTQMNNDSRRLFMAGYQEMMRRLNPQQILFYGDIPKSCKGSIIYIPPYQKRLRSIKREVM